MTNTADSETPSAADLLTIPEAAQYAPAFGQRFIRRLLDMRTLPKVKIGGRVFVSRRDLDALVAAHRDPPAPD
ncbi:MAG: helix-turn-helix domain-containing protein [Acidimicrobiales bacterium]